MKFKYLVAASVAGLTAATAFAPTAVIAQETTSAIRGTVTVDGTPVSGATVVATDTRAGTRSTTSTDAAGAFVFSGLTAGGPYTVEVTSDRGSQTITDIFTVVQQPYELPINLAGVADDANVIVVTATSIRGAGVKSDGPQTVLGAREIANVASVNRDIRDVQRRDPFANIDLSNAGDRGGAVSFAGVNPRFNRFTINGVTVGDTFGLNQDASPNIRGPVPLDALAQVSTSIAPYDFRQSGFQGGAIDTVLKSGTNEFHGTAFYSQNTDGLSGDEIGDVTIVTPKFKSETYGATISGPIFRDTLFFMISGERNTDPRPFSTQLASFSNPTLVNQAITDVTAIASAKNLQAGEILTINDRKDEKVVGKIDWNVMDGQRLSLSYINSFNVQTSPNNTSTSSSAPRYGLSSNAYELSELLRAGIVQLNSDWTDALSTEARLIYRWTRRGQEPLLGRTHGQFSVCSDAASGGSATGCSTGVPTITFGPDNFRQTNQLFYDTWAGSLLGRYKAGDHQISALFEITRNRTFNNFVPNSLGSWYFDSRADFQAGRANSVSYAAVIGGDPSVAAADFNYAAYTVGMQDVWSLTDTFTLTYGARYTMYDMDTYPVLNPFFAQRHGFTNLKTYKGLDQIEPRISFSWTPDAMPLRLRGGVGIFGGGSPDIYLSNSFSNTVTTNTLSITRDATCNTPGTLCDQALNNVTGQIPAALASAASSPTLNPNLPRTNTGAISPDFHLPRSLKATLSADYDFWGINFGADYYYGENIDGIGFTDLRSRPVGTLPDGRPRYQNTFFPNDNNFDILVYNTKDGRSHIGVVRFQKDFDWGLSFGGSYTLQDVKDVGNATSSTITSNYRNQAFVDPNFPAYGISSDQIKWAFKYNLSYDHAFFGDYRTVFALFGETRAGRPYSYTMLDNTFARQDVFGTPLGGSSSPTHLIYVPTGTSDALVQYGDATTAAALDAFINSTELAKYRGQIAPKNIARSRAFTRIDLHLEQELPTFVGASRLSVFADINNLPNLINKDWGGLRQFGFPPAAALVNVQCVTSAGAVIPTGTQVGTPTNPANGCARYQYSGFRAPNDSSLNVTQSLYAIRLGVRFTF